MKRAVLPPIFLAILFLSPVSALAATPAELAEDVAALVASGAGILMPNLDEPHVEDRGVLPFTNDVPATFLQGLVPRLEGGITTYPVFVQLDAVTGDAVFFNADGAPFYLVPRVGPANWLSLRRPLLAPGNPLYAPDRVVAVWTLVPAESIAVYHEIHETYSGLNRLRRVASGGLDAWQPWEVRRPAAPSVIPSAITNLLFTAISVSASNVVLDVAWPAEAIPAYEPLDLYFATNLAAEAWTLLATEFPASPTNLTFSVDGANLPGFLSSATAHIHDETCVPVTNIVTGVFLPGEVTTNVTYSCSTNPPGPAVAGFFRAGTRHDFDTDGLPDAYEALVSLTDSTLADTDGDGLGDGEELGLGTDPQNRDSDGDCLGDGVEQGGVLRLPTFQWTDIVPTTNLLSGLPDMDGLTRTVPLPAHVTILGTTFDRVAVSLDGCVQLLAEDSPAVTAYPYANSDLATWKPSNAATNELLLAVNACDLQSVAANGTQLLVGTSPDGSSVVVEYRNVSRHRCTEPATFQAVMPTNSPGTVLFNYLEIPPSLETNRTQIAVQSRFRHPYASPSDFQTVVWCRNAPAEMQGGTSLLFHIGTGTDPRWADTDTDGLTDSDELCVHGTNPLSSDSDGDGLSDSVEVQLGLNPVHPDTDGDTMPDGWEVSRGLAPADASDASGDADQDGVTNAEEFRHGTHPWMSDTDTDGLSDFAETPRMRKLPASAVPWYDMTGAEVLSPSNVVDDAVYSFPLSVPALVCGVLCTNLLADSNGLVTFASAARNSSHSSRASNANLETTRIWQFDPAVAAYWDDLVFRPELGSALLATNVVEENGFRCVVEYRNVGFYANATNRVTFQVSFLCGSPTNAVFVRYGEIVNPQQGASATFGAQGPDRFVALLDSHNVTNPVAGTAVAYEFGTGSRPYAADTDTDGLSDLEEVALGTNPHLSDTDGDSLSDDWEVVNGLDPNSAMGDDGRDGDPDGDGRINALERANGSSPQLCDSDGDGIPDGMSGTAWSNHVLRASVAGTTNLLVSYAATVPANGSCALRVGPLTLPLSGSGAIPLCLVPGAAYDFRLASTGGATASLSLLNPANGTESPEGFFLRDPDGVFGGTPLSTGAGAFGFLTLGLRMVPEGLSECVHETPGVREYEVLCSPMAWAVVRDLAQIDGFAVQADGHVTLSVADAPPSVATGTITVPSPFAFYPSASVSASVHRCEFPLFDECKICGEIHDTLGLSVDMSTNRIITSVYETGRREISLDTSSSTSEVIFRIEPEVEGGARLHMTENEITPLLRTEPANRVWISHGTISGRYSVIASHPVASDVCYTTEVYVVECVIDVNNTSGNGDDVVCRYSTNPPGRPTILCRAYIDGWPLDMEDPVVTFTCDKLRFPNETNVALCLTMDATGNGSHFRISGQTASETIGDAMMEARIASVRNLLVGVRSVTVLWVDDFTLASEQDALFSENNASVLKPEPPRLGFQLLQPFPTVPSVSRVVEIKAIVHPQDTFEKPYLERDCIGYYSARSIGNSDIQTDKINASISRGNGHGNDTTEHTLRYDNENYDGILFDIDTPGFQIGSLQRARLNEEGTVFYIRENFLEFAVYGGVRCSDDFPWHVRVTAIKTAPSGLDGYQLHTCDGHTSDNVAGIGHTILSATEGD